MHRTRWAEKDEIPLLAEFWYKMQCEMGRKDGIPIPEKDRIIEIQTFFNRG